MPFYAQLKMKLEFCTETMSDPEARKVSERALNTLKSACSIDENSKFIKTVEEMTLLLENELATHSISITNRNAYKFMVILVTNMCNGQFFELEEWRKVFEKYIPNEPNVKTVAETILKVTMESFTVKEEHFEDTEEGKDLYKGTFSLAYGALTLFK